MKPKTIKRKPSWPKWAKWYAAYPDGYAFISNEMPRLLERFGEYRWFVSAYGDFIQVSWRKPYRTTAWQSSLRRIVT